MGNMNTTITKNNLELFLKKLDSNSKLNDEWMSYKSFLSDGIRLIDLCVNELNHKDEVIRVNFKQDAIKLIDNKQNQIKILRLENENKELKDLCKELETKITKIIDAV